MFFWTVRRPHVHRPHMRRQQRDVDLASDLGHQTANEGWIQW